ncbi:MAG TPA: hypothetical protein VJY34_09560 [Roseiarcus sp.]|nr:hypothetical protein [Roseiarcus sp.]
MNAIFAAGLVILAIFLGFVGVLAAVQPEVERVSYLRHRFDISVYASLAGVILSGAVSAGALARLSGYHVRTDWIIFGVYLLILAVVIATVSLAWAISL